LDSSISIECEVAVPADEASLILLNNLCVAGFQSAYLSTPDWSCSSSGLIDSSFSNRSVAYFFVNDWDTFGVIVGDNAPQPLNVTDMQSASKLGSLWSSLPSWLISFGGMIGIITILTLLMAMVLGLSFHKRYKLYQIQRRNRSHLQEEQMQDIASDSVSI